MRKTCFLFIACIICSSTSRNACTRKSPFKSKEILVKYTHRKANGNKLRSSSKKGNIVWSSRWSSQLGKTFRNIAGKTKMTHSVSQVYKRFHGNFYWVISKLSKKTVETFQTIHPQFQTYENIPRQSLQPKTTTHFCNSCLWNWKPTHFRQQALVGEICFALHSTFRSRETCKVEIQHLKKFNISKIFCEYQTFLFVWFRVVCISKPTGF